ncbi:MAG: PDDEXK nuclease domain-containing protein [Cetobacterium sp.]|uniref:PDDEXK nuclease domain-containing protein n=1 Tax=Cetobacterium sp. TaxID=2071632 RepID=UPI003F32B77A
MENNEIRNLDIQGNCTYIISLIETSKSSTLKAINSELIILYWKIGEYIQKDILDKADKIYGENIVVELSKRLTFQYGRGFSRSNLLRMIQFYKAFKNFENVATLSRQLSWSHFVELIKIENELKREFYVAMAINEGWSVRVFKERINSMLFERTAISKKPEETIKKDLELLSNQKIMTESLFIKDPYILDFLGLEDSYSEKDLEDRILQELEKFLLEFGSDFAFMGRQKRIQIGNKDYYLDLLFYHRKMRRLVLIELKLGEFEPQYKGQVELYLKWLSKYEKQEFEEEPIAIILCASKDSEEIELLGLTEGNICVSEYLANLPPKKLLEEKLHKVITEAKELVAQK